MTRIQFLQDTSTAEIPAEFHNGDTFVVYREGYALPKVEGARYIDFNQYKVQYAELEPKCLVIVGLNRIITPSNRCEFVFEHLFTLTNSLVKFSIDTLPFIGEPWRLWFHYGIVFGEWLKMNYSYVVETDWQKWFFREADSCVLWDELRVKGTDGKAVCDLPRLNTRYDFREPEPSEVQLYTVVKEQAFERYATPKTLINFMLKQLKGISAGKALSFDDWKTNNLYVLPDFGIFRFTAVENLRRQDIYNAYARGTSE